MRTLGIILLLLASSARGQVRATLPLEGYYRAGMCVPVRVEGTTTADVVEVRGDGVLGATVVPSGGRFNAVVPIVPAGAVHQLWVEGSPVPLTLRPLPLPDRARLVGAALATTRPSSAPLEPSFVVIPLDPLDPVPGPAMAWEAMDELLIDATGAGRLGEHRLLELLAVGVDIVVLGDARPAGALPWQREGDRWALRYAPLGPRGSVFPPAMLPVAGWEPGMPEPVRRQALLAGVLFAIVATAVAMWRSRHAVLASAALVGVTVIGLRVWESRQAPIRWTEGTVAIERGPFTQRDTWQYVLATEPHEDALPAGRRVVAGSPDALLRQPGIFQHRIPRGGRIAIFSRSLLMGSTTGPVDPTVTSPLAPLVKAGYLRPGVTIVGQVTEGGWPTVVLRAAGP